MRKTTNRANSATSLGARRRSASFMVRLVGGASALALSGMLAASPLSAAECTFSPVTQLSIDTGAEPQLLIDGPCVDPDYNEQTFVVDKTEQLTFQMPDGGPLVPYTQVTGHFPATSRLSSEPEAAGRKALPDYVRQSPTTFRQDYEFRFPAKEFFKNRSFQAQHPSGGGRVDNHLAFVNGAYSIRWGSASTANAVASHRHQAAATKVAEAYANRLYGNTGKIYHYTWGCSGGGTVAMAHAENTTGVWDGVQPHCIGTSGDAPYHSFYWQAHYTMAIPKEKREAIAAAAAPGGTGDIYAGLNAEEKAVLDEFLAAGYPLQIIGDHFKSLIPLVDPIDIRLFDPTYEDDFWSRPGYAGVNPPNYLKAALVDGWATVSDITRDADGKITAIRFDPATLPALGSIGDTYLEYWIYGPDGKTRLIDPARTFGPPPENKRRYSLQGKLDPATATLTLTGTNRDVFGGESPILNSHVLTEALKVGSKVRINNRFILAMYYYPRYSNIPGGRSYDQYRNADGTPKYPQREDISVLSHSNYRTMGGRVETGDVKTKVMVLEGMADNLSWPIFNTNYAERIERALGPAKADEMMRLYVHDNGRHAAGAGEMEVFHQSLQDMMAWAEQGVAPPPSTEYVVRNGQVVMPARAAERRGLQPVMNLAVDGSQRATVGVDQPVNLAARLEMPPGAGKIVKYHWTVAGTDDAEVIVAEPQTQVDVSRSLRFDKPGTYVVRLTVRGQRHGLQNPANQTLMRNFQEVQVVVR
jgi:hypothetical protein